jgi:hypothetical protein
MSSGTAELLAQSELRLLVNSSTPKLASDPLLVGRPSSTDFDNQSSSGRERPIPLRAYWQASHGGAT